MEQTLKRHVSLKDASGVVPSLFTVGNMALGFFAIMQAFQSRWVSAATAIFIAHVLDIFDGRVARWIGKTSSFGGEFDSFADWMSFGIAPAIMVHRLALAEFGKLGFSLAFLFVLCAAIRLARFNLKAMDGDAAAPSLNFTGLPTPGAGGFLAVLVLLCGLSQQGHQGRTMGILYHKIPVLQEAIPVIVLGLSLLMVSRVQYSTFKKTALFRPQSTHTFLVMLFVVFLIYAYPQNTIFFLYLGYVLWGLLSTGWRAYRLRRTASV